MNKILISMILAMMLGICGAFAAMTATQEQYDALNFTSMSLQYLFSDIQYNPDTMTIFVDASYFTAVPFVVNDDRYMLLSRKVTRYTYDGTDFWDCTLTTPDVTCFQTWIAPLWLKKFQILDRVHRNYLRSLQSQGQPFFSYELRTYTARYNS